MTDDQIYNHALKVYQQAVDASGDLRQYYLKQARNILANLPNNYTGKKQLEDKIRSMLY